MRAITSVRRIGFPLLLVMLVSVILWMTLMTESVLAKTTIRFMAPPRQTAFGDDLNELLIEVFEYDHPHIDVEYTPASGDWPTKVSVEFLAGTGADVIAGWESFFRTWLEQGWALPLDRYLPGGYLSDFVPSHVQLYNIDGVQYALPFFTGVSGIFYNVNMFDAAGVPYPDETWDWDTLVEMGRKLTKKDGARTTQYGFDVEMGWDRVVQFIWENGGRVIDDGEFVGDHVYLDEFEAIEALEYQRDLIWDHEISPHWPQLGVSPWVGFWQGMAAMWQSGSWDVSATMNNANFDWNVAVRPRGRTGIASATHTQDGFLVNAATKHPQEAVEFLLFLTGPVAQEIIMFNGDLQPARLSLGGTYARDTVAAERGINMEVFIEQTAYARPAPLFTKHNEVIQLLFPTFDQIFADQVPASSGLRDVTAQINAILASDE